MLRQAVGGGGVDVSCHELVVDHLVLVLANGTLQSICGRSHGCFGQNMMGFLLERLRYSAQIGELPFVVGETLLVVGEPPRVLSSAPGIST